STTEGLQNRQAIKRLEQVLSENPLNWITPGRKSWTLDLDALRAFNPDTHRAPSHTLAELTWLVGKVAIAPEVESRTQHPRNDVPTYETNVVFYIDPESVDHCRNGGAVFTEPVEITESLQRFRVDYPDPTAAAFLMMKFGDTT